MNSRGHHTRSGNLWLAVHRSSLRKTDRYPLRRRLLHALQSGARHRVGVGRGPRRAAVLDAVDDEKCVAAGEVCAPRVLDGAKRLGYPGPRRHLAPDAQAAEACRRARLADAAEPRGRGGPGFPGGLDGFHGLWTE